MNQHIPLGKALLLLGLLTDAVGSICGGGLLFLSPVGLLLDVCGLVLVFKNRKAKQ